MKRFLIIFFILLIASTLYAGEKVHWSYRALQWTYYGSNYADYALTSYVTSSGRAVEMNPVMNWYLEETELAYGIITAQNVLTHLLTNWLYKHSRVLGYAALIIYNAAKALAICRAMQAFD